jgi:hypothetical protein
MSADKLLLWMSARTSGSWAQFRAAVEQMHAGDDETGGEAGTDEDADPGGLPLYQALRLNLQRLGHAEFSSTPRGLEWRVTPPSIATVPQPDGALGVVAGARSLKLLDRLSVAGGSRLARSSSPGCPEILLMRGADTLELEAIAREAGLHVQADAAQALLTCLPAIDDALVRRRSELPIGADWRIECFDPRAMRWKQSERQDATAARRALFRFTLGYQRHILLCDRGMCFQIPAQVGKYVVARRRNRRVLRYDRAARTLAIPAVYRPPFLIERALILCSGAPPRYEARDQTSGELMYFQVSDEVAGLAGSILRQELR